MAVDYDLVEIIPFILNYPNIDVNAINILNRIF